MVSTQYIARGAIDWVSIFLETGIMRASQVVYDRAGASIADVAVSDFDWDSIFENADWFHTTGITPALSGQGGNAH